MNDLGGIVPFVNSLQIASAFFAFFEGEYPSHSEKFNFPIARGLPPWAWHVRQEFSMIRRISWGTEAESPGASSMADNGLSRCTAEPVITNATSDIPTANKLIFIGVILSNLYTQAI